MTDENPPGGGSGAHPGEELVYRYEGPPELELRRWPIRGGRWMHRWDQQGRLPGVVILATDGESMLFIRQYREAVGGWLWQLPRGYRDVLDADELAAARRELEEETGETSGPEDARLIGRVWVDPGLLSTGADLVEVRIAGAGSAPGADAADEGIRAVRMVPLAEIPAWIGSGELTDGLTLAALARYLADPRVVGAS